MLAGYFCISEKNVLFLKKYVKIENVVPNERQGERRQSVKILKMHLTEVAVAFLFIVIVCVFTHRDEGESLESMSWNRNWTLAAGEESRSYEIFLNQSTCRKVKRRL